MKAPALLLLVALAPLLVSCGKKQVPVDSPPPPPVAAKPVPEPVKPAAVEAASPPVAIPVEDQSPDEEEPSAPDTDVVQPTPGERLDHAIDKTEQGVRTAAEKTEEGLRKAAEKTGGALQRVGETIQRKAEETKPRR